MTEIPATRTLGWKERAGLLWLPSKIRRFTLHLYWRFILRAAYGKPATIIGRMIYRWLASFKGANYAAQKLHLYSTKFMPWGPSAVRPLFSFRGSEFRSQILQGVGETKNQTSAGAPRRAENLSIMPTRSPRVGCLGHFAGLLSFGLPFFSEAPSDVELFVFDVAFRGKTLERLGSLGITYFPFQHYNEDAQSSTALVTAINEAGLDVLLCIWPKVSFDVLDRIDVPCLIDVCTGSGILWHPAVALHLYSQLTPTARLEGGSLICNITNRPLGPGRYAYVDMIYDRRDLADAPCLSWRKREPLIFAFGSLGKFAFPPFLKTIFDVMADDRNLDFVLMGKDEGGALNKIMKCANSAGVANRTHYVGVFNASRDEEGQFPDPSWARCKEYLRRARLSPGPWPRASGSARFESYLSGVPFSYMGLPPDYARLDKQVFVHADLPVLAVPEAAAYTPAAYGDRVRRLLYDEAYSDHVARRQLEVAALAGDPRRWWREFTNCYGSWLESSRTSSAG